MKKWIKNLFLSDKTLKLYTYVSIISFNIFILFVLVNVAFYDFSASETRREKRESLQKVWANSYDMDLYRSVYPGKSKGEIKNLMSLSVWAGGRYEPYIQIITEPGVVTAKNHLTNEVKWMAVHEVGFRFIGPEQGPWPPDPNALTVFVFGGSTTAGSGVLDHQTIPAQLQTILRRRHPGLAVNVYNFGTAGHFSFQESIFLDWLLLRGYVPDVAVFVDGYNDFAVWKGKPGLTPWFKKAFKDEAIRQKGYDFSHHLKVFLNALPFATYIRSLAAKQTIETYGTDHLFDGGGFPEFRFSNPKKIEQVIERYYRTKKKTESLGATYGVRNLFVWQPVSIYKYDGPLRQDGRYKGLKEMGGEGSRTKWGYPAMRKRIQEEPLGDNFQWCADIQEGIDELLYIDQAIHYTTRGAELVAECVADGLEKQGYLSKRNNPR